MSKAVYLAGPMRGYPQYNFPAFDAVAARLRAMGYRVLSPAEMDRYHGFDERAGHSERELAGLMREVIRRDLEAVMHVHALALLPGWEASQGAQVELALARLLGLEVLDATTGKPLGEVPAAPAGDEFRIVGLAGYARSGKDTVAKALGDGWTRVAFADALKPPIDKLALELGLDPDQAKHKELVRPLYVEYGRLGRKAHPDHWVMMASNEVNRLRAAGTNRIVVTDVRYPNEAKWIIEQGGLVAYLRRDGTKPANDEEDESLYQLRRMDGVQHLLNVEGSPDQAASELARRIELHYARKAG